MNQFIHTVSRCLGFVLIGCCASSSAAEQTVNGRTAAQGKPHLVTIARGDLVLSAPASWIVKKPRTRIVSHEFAIPAADDDEENGRLTIMGAGGSIQANIDRWMGQFTQSDGSDTKTKSTTKIAEKEVAGHKISLVDVSGTYQDRPRGPFGPVVARPDYRMLAAIVQTNGKGNYFIKLYGPSATIAGAEEQFQGFVESLRATK